VKLDRSGLAKCDDMKERKTSTWLRDVLSVVAVSCELLVNHGRVVGVASDVR